MMMTPHFGFIAAAYLSTFVIIGGVMLWVIADYRVQARKLSVLEEQGFVRRSARAATPADRPDWDT